MCCRKEFCSEHNIHYVLNTQTEIYIKESITIKIKTYFILYNTNSKMIELKIFACTAKLATDYFH